MRISQLPERVRFWLAALAFFASWWAAEVGLAHLAHGLGLPTVIHYETPVTRWLYTANRWREVELNREDTSYGLLITVLSVVLAWYMTRLVYHGKWQPAFAQRERWLLAGWVLAAPIMVATFMVLEAVHLDWIAPLGWFGGLIWGAIVWVVAAGWSHVWDWVMRRSGVPRPRFT